MPTSRNKPPPPPPVPPEPTCPPPPTQSSITFKPPVRRILTSADLVLFQSSPTHKLILSFITDLNNSVLNLPLSTAVAKPPVIDSLLEILSQINTLVEQTPPLEAGGSRFGNKAFQTFYDTLGERAAGLHDQVLASLTDGKVRAGALQEITAYLRESFGNRSRIDYGSGHELNFLTYLLCFRQLSLITPQDYPAIVLRVFTTYLNVMRRIQTTYYLEPAGSHGVWGLDDYQFLPFLFGSAQLYSHPYLRPKSIHNEEILEEFRGEYIYLECIAFINSIKVTAGLRWHSPMLDDISGARHWGRINDGMRAMYEAEVLGKLPIMQHFLFGGLVEAVEGIGEGGGEGEGEGSEVVDREGMTHVHSTWGECCGIKVPAAIGARKAGEQQALRKVSRIPFD